MTFQSANLRVSVSASRARPPRAQSSACGPDMIRVKKRESLDRVSIIPKALFDGVPKSISITGLSDGRSLANPRVLSNETVARARGVPGTK